MIVEHFLKWVEGARVAERAAAASALARAYVVSPMEFEDRCAAEAALTLLLDDPSPKVRQAMAEALAVSPKAPPQVVAGLAADQPEVAAYVLALSPVLSDGELIDRVAEGDTAAQVMIASRASVSMALAAAIAEVGEAAACRELLANSGAVIAALSFRRIAERHGADAATRERLIADPRLPCDVRHTLLLEVGKALSHSQFVRTLMGPARAERIARDACVSASLTLIDGTPGDEHAALIEHLRLRGDITTSFLIRMIAHGKVDFFGAVLVALTGQGAPRIRALLAQGRDVALSALFRTARLPEAAHGAILRALKVWREVANGRRVAGPQEVSFLMLRELGETLPNTPAGELATLLKAIHLAALRDNARGHALAIASQPPQEPRDEVAEHVETGLLEPIGEAA